MLSLADYTVGWICALDIELAAVVGSWTSVMVLRHYLQMIGTVIPSVGLGIAMWSLLAFHRE